MSSPSELSQSPGRQCIFGVFKAHRTLLVDRTVPTKPVFFRKKIHSTAPALPPPFGYSPVKSALNFESHPLVDRDLGIFLRVLRQCMVNLDPMLDVLFIL